MSGRGRRDGVFEAKEQMSINMKDPQTLMEKLDAASNYVAQITLALRMGDRSHASQCADKAGCLLFEAMRIAEALPEPPQPKGEK